MSTSISFNRHATRCASTPFPQGAFPYKDALPEDTVGKIKRILASIGIRTRETFYENRDLCYSCRITIDNNGLETLDIGTNGKGMTQAYSLASGYAEFMERLQNKFLVYEAMRHSRKIPDGEKMSFRFFPDEEPKCCDLEEFLKTTEELFPNYSHPSLSDILRLINVETKEGTPQTEWLGIPFARLGQEKRLQTIEHVPIILARANSSTGLCAGNTPQEAILQGINEIFERYVLQRIYLDCLTPPSFPDGYFKETCIGKKLEELKSQGYVYDTKDLSLGKGFPVVGLILTNTNNGTTMFRLGADISPEIALERCLTEIYQGRTEKETRFLEYPRHEAIDMRNNPSIRNKEYLKSLRDGTGYFPQELFMGKNSYDFQPPVLQRSGNTKKDFRNVLQFLYERHYTPLVRDNSFLGFCTYHVIIPGLSEQDYRLRDIFAEYLMSPDFNAGYMRQTTKNEESGKIWPLYNIKSETDLREFIHKHYPNDETLRLAPYCPSPRNYVNKNLLLFLSAVQNEDYQNANRYFSHFLLSRNEQGYPYEEYLACTGSYIYWKAQSAGEQDIQAWLKHFYSEETVTEVLNDFSNPSEIMKNYSFPTCFDCAGCPLAADCRYRNAINFEQAIQQLQKHNPIDQNRLFMLLN